MDHGKVLSAIHLCALYTNNYGSNMDTQL